MTPASAGTTSTRTRAGAANADDPRERGDDAINVIYGGGYDG